MCQNVPALLPLFLSFGRWGLGTRLLNVVTKTFRGVYANVKPRLCRSNSTSVTCQNIPGPPPAFPIVWEVGPGNEAMIWYCMCVREYGSTLYIGIHQSFQWLTFNSKMKCATGLESRYSSPTSRQLQMVTVHV